MKLLDYLQISQAEMQEYIDSGMIDVSHHDEFPLTLFSYGRKATHENTWPEPVRKCRGLIIRDSDDEIIARPFEKFFNLGTGGMPETELSAVTREPDYLYEKMDGFMCTMYRWEGKDYIASKGSFHSPHAKWATAVYNTREHEWPEGYTPVFEGLSSSLRIVINYGEREELVLLGLINIETGEEANAYVLKTWATKNGFTTPPICYQKLVVVNEHSLNPDNKNFEGYVAVWRRPGQTPFRLKIKFIDYLRLHRMVCGVSPKAIYEALVNGWASEFDEWTNESTPWFSKFVSKWKNALQSEYESVMAKALPVYTNAGHIALEAAKEGRILTRKEWATMFTTDENKPISGVLFGMLDGKDISAIVWKLVKPMIKGSHPMVDAAKT